MAFLHEEVLRDVYVITPGEKNKIKDFMRGKVDLWIEKNGDGVFTVSDLLV